MCNGGPVSNIEEEEESSEEEEVPAPPPEPVPSTSRGNPRSPVRAQRWTYLVRQRQQRPYFHNPYSTLPTVAPPDFELANYLMNEPRAYSPFTFPSNPRPDMERDGNRIQFSASLSFPTTSNGNGNIPREYSIRFDTQPPPTDNNRIIPGYPSWRNYQQQQPPRRLTVPFSAPPPPVMVGEWDVGGFYGENVPQQNVQNLHPGPAMMHPSGQNMQHRSQHLQQNIPQPGIHHENSQNIHQPGTSSQNSNHLHNNSSQQNLYPGGQFNNHGQMQNPPRR